MVSVCPISITCRNLIPQCVLEGGVQREVLVSWRQSPHEWINVLLKGLQELPPEYGPVISLPLLHQPKDQKEVLNLDSSASRTMSQI